MSSKNSTEAKKLRREARLSKKDNSTMVVKYIPVTNKYGMARHSPIKMPAGMFK